MKQSDKLSLLPPYLFAALDRKKSELRQKGKTVIDLGVGDPDLLPPPGVIAALKKALKNPAVHRYPPYQGTEQFKKAVAEYYKERFSVKLSPENEVLALIGSKEGIAHLPFALLSGGEMVLVPDPGYPPYGSASLYAGGKLHFMPLKQENNFLPDFSRIPNKILRQTALLFLNYPNNPTGAIADREFLKAAVGLAKKYDFIIAYDNAYGEIIFGEQSPLSILQLKEAKKVAVEFNSLSKSFNLTGWRLGFMLGCGEVVSALLKFKTLLDSGAFSAIQAAGAYALTYEKDFPARMREIYRRRRDLMLKGLKQAGLEVLNSPGTFYLWGRTPKGKSSLDFCREILEKTGVLLTPGVGFGKYGEGYFRISLTCKETLLKEAIQKLKENYGS